MGTVLQVIKLWFLDDVANQVQVASNILKTTAATGEWSPQEVSCLYTPTDYIQVIFHTTSS